MKRPGTIETVTLELVVVRPEEDGNPACANGRGATWYSREERDRYPQRRKERLLPIDPNGRLTDMTLFCQSLAAMWLRELGAETEQVEIDGVSTAVLVDVYHADVRALPEAEQGFALQRHALRTTWASAKAKLDDAARAAKGEKPLFGIAGDLRAEAASPFARRVAGGLEAVVRIDVEAGIAALLRRLEAVIADLRSK